MTEPCTVKGCEDARFSLGLCSRHYSRLRRGRPLDEDPEPIEDPQRVVVVLPGQLYGFIKQAASKRRIAASSLIRQMLQKEFAP